MQNVGLGTVTSYEHTHSALVIDREDLLTILMRRHSLGGSLG